MSRHRNMVLALLLLGKTPDEIAAEVPMDPRNLAENLKDDWPIRKRFVAPLEDYAQGVMRQAYATASPPEKAVIADAFMGTFGLSIHDAPALGHDARRAAYVAWLLCIPPDFVFPSGPECNPEADDHLSMSVRTLLRGLLNEARRSPDRTPAAMRYISTLCHVDAVMEGREDPAANGWFRNLMGYRRGMYELRPKSIMRRAAG